MENEHVVEIMRENYFYEHREHKAFLHNRGVVLFVGLKYMTHT